MNVTNITDSIKRQLNINFHPFFGRVWNYFTGVEFYDENGKPYSENRQVEIKEIGREYISLKETSSKKDFISKLKKYPMVFKDEISELEKSVI